MTDIAARLGQVRARIEEVARACGRDPGTIRLVAVSKTHRVEVVRAAAAAGQREFGENQLQEALPKIAATSDLGLVWHFIGPLQSNKTRGVAEHFDWVHSIDRLRIAERLSTQRPAVLPPLQVCIQVNTSGEASKSGVPSAEALALARAVATLPRLRLRGVMAIPQPEADATRQLEACLAVRAVFEQLRTAGLELDTLSLGMSADLEAAVQAGSTLLRIGTDIFGARG
ncbi:MAG TPA: YggS family pyridoxal phosphate-dependent enzyme [Nevskiales bacterium]|nr:YggS family pyridoxal phosphate-dependent enzyme [Nevskiales bacterium]